MKDNFKVLFYIDQKIMFYKYITYNHVVINDKTCLMIKENTLYNEFTTIDYEITHTQSNIIYVIII
jgi:hypothetical protein